MPGDNEAREILLAPLFFFSVSKTFLGTTGENIMFLKRKYVCVCMCSYIYILPHTVYLCMNCLFTLVCEYSNIMMYLFVIPLISIDLISCRDAYTLPGPHLEHHGHGAEGGFWWNVFGNK